MSNYSKVPERKVTQLYWVLQDTVKALYEARESRFEIEKEVALALTEAEKEVPF